MPIFLPYYLVSYPCSNIDWHLTNYRPLYLPPPIPIPLPITAYPF